MRWASWLLVILGVVFLGVGIWAYTASAGPADRNSALVAPMLVAGAILLAAGVAIMSCGGCYGCDDCGYGGCSCDHCGTCAKGDCCGSCACVEGGPDPEHPHGEGHEHSH